MNLLNINQEKNDFLNDNDIEITNDTVMSYTSTRSYTNIVSDKIS